MSLLARNEKSEALLTWHNRLSEHFEVLAAERLGNDWPVFALEHGLSDSDVHLLENEVKASLIAQQPNRRVFLPWVVYAAEFGYQYSGDEYWQSFTEKTPGWKNPSTSSSPA
jgi:hypothetical protein